MSKKLIKIVALLFVCALLVSCASPNPVAEGLPLPADAIPAGFWRGLWHGITAAFAFIGKLFGMNIGVYEVNNTGGWYDFGFLLGVGAFAGSGSSSSRR
jgi:hypothetical protein